MSTPTEMALRAEFDDHSTTDERRREILTQLKTGQYSCFSCHQRFVYVSHTHALAPGHIYSREGLAEVKLSQLCEYCFDEITLRP